MKRKLKLSTYDIVGRAVDEGVRFGYRHAYKHTNTPANEEIIEYISREVMNALCDVIRFDV